MTLQRVEMSIAEDDPPRERSAAKLRFRLRFRPLAYASMAVNLSATIVGAIATFAGTEWSADRDVILAQFRQFNPCIFYDWYPAKIPALLLMSFGAIIHVLQTLLIAVYAVAHGDTGLIVAAMPFCTLTVAAAASFLNIFSTQLYPEDVILPPERRRLAHPAAPRWNATHPYEVTDTDTEMITLHAAFYVVWLLAHVVGMVFFWVLARHANGYSGSKSSPGAVFAGACWRRALLSALYVWGACCVYASAIVAFEFARQGAPSDDGLSGFVPTTVVQRICKAWHDTFYTGPWHFVVVFFYPFVLRAGVGVEVTCTLARPADDGDRRDGATRATPFSEATILSVAVRVLIVLGWHLYLYDDPWAGATAEESSMGGAAIVRRALNESPQNLFAMPVVFGAVVLTLLSIACAVVREALRIADRAPVAPTVGEPAAPRRRRSTTVAFATAAIGATRDDAPPAAAALSPRLQLVAFAVCGAIFWVLLLLNVLQCMPELRDGPLIGRVTDVGCVLAFGPWVLVQHRVIAAARARRWREAARPAAFVALLLVFSAVSFVSLAGSVLVIVLLALYDVVVGRPQVWVAARVLELPPDGAHWLYCDARPPPPSRAAAMVGVREVC